MHIRADKAKVNQHRCVRTAIHESYPQQPAPYSLNYIFEATLKTGHCTSLQHIIKSPIQLLTYHYNSPPVTFGLFLHDKLSTARLLMRMFTWQHHFL